ncbi:MAG: IS701 family transposase [Gammaproteobacteria bacterium (ex Lamellibrachia satsuma)]|nr:MAG: IS701 family transposase [Gammaproteobacteria bacterium (ex Lamellibrachia satsuma)]QYZ64560.1 MAG: IS701 family transposase [Gammaproteobacteria bacterium (ex Lamellibrachia satsuma)]QYZ64634.1 MAG: IS701 family transposase [Gammaproteobacteria bacterium (ex Lamellibrachia satsuma)]QYZ64686.1 MAG: IS701 family transposase [Gammaproteobacteria bacterium (ex Lamellibrachia satsuma)]QYZ64876.1 MAG: IS701 family transposase [Gammaproteobacteria bacterium (ex Lamellibrachia satsuma)]
MQAQRKNMERMEEVVAGADDQRLQHMLTESPWDHRAVLDQVALEADQWLGGTADTCLLLDESGLAKKGKHSVGVKRQWNGRQGKVDNCQVGVFAALGKGHLSTLIDERLYLPKEWVSNPARCRKAGIPEVERKHQSKSELALEMVRHQRTLGLRFAWVGADGGYGKDPAFLRGLEAMGETFVVDIHKDQQVYLEDPQPFIPESTTTRGRRRSRLQAQAARLRVDQWLNEQRDSEWQQVVLRDSSKGKLRVEILHHRVWLWDGKEAQAHQWHLIVRREVNSPETIKYTLSNAPEETPSHCLAKMQAQRFWVERSFQDGKSESGLADYQARKWKSWHHHMALVMMAMLFMLEERIVQKDDHPLLSCSDIESLLRAFLPRRDIERDEILRQMTKRHRKRQAAIDSQYRKQTLEQSVAG